MGAQADQRTRKLSASAITVMLLFTGLLAVPIAAAAVTSSCTITAGVDYIAIEYTKQNTGVTENQVSATSTATLTLPDGSSTVLAGKSGALGAGPDTVTLHWIYQTDNDPGEYSASVSDSATQNSAPTANCGPVTLEQYHDTADIPDIQVLSQSGASDIAFGDFDRDGDQDAAVVSGATSGLDIWYQTSPGTYTKTDLNGGDYDLVETGDFDNDGNTDVIASGPAGMIMYRNTASGLNNVFSATTLHQADDMVVADFDNDGHSDVVWRTGQTPRERLGQAGTPYLGGHQSASVTTAGPGRIVAIDTDGDAILEVAIQTTAGFTHYGEGSGRILGTDTDYGSMTANGGGTFGIAVTDLDQDGSDDLVVGANIPDDCPIPCNANYQLRLYRTAPGLPSGNGEASISWGTSSMHGLWSADRNQDGVEELYAYDDVAKDLEEIPVGGELLADDANQVEAITPGGSITQILVTDPDADGDYDLVTLTSGTADAYTTINSNGPMAIGHGQALNGDAYWGKRITRPTTDTQEGRVTPVLDCTTSIEHLAVKTYDFVSPGAYNHVLSWPGYANGCGTHTLGFTDHVLSGTHGSMHQWNLATPANPANPSVPAATGSSSYYGHFLEADIDQDGDADIIATDRDKGIHIIEGDGGSSWTHTHELTLPGANENTHGWLGVGDFNPGGNLELVYGIFKQSTPWDIYLVTYDGATLSLGPSLSNSVNLHGQPVVTDIDNDGDTDIILPTKTGIQIARNDGSAPVIEPQLSPSSKAQVAGVIDVNLDGLLDIVSLEVDESVSPDQSTNKIRFWVQDLNGNFGHDVSLDYQYGQGILNYNLPIADITGNGFQDIVYAYTDLGQTFIVVEENQGDGAFITKNCGAPGGNTLQVAYLPYTISIVDSNRDGRPDLHVGMLDTSVVPQQGVHQILINDGGCFLAQEAEGNRADVVNPSAFSMAPDLNQDGIIDRVYAQGEDLILNTLEPSFQDHVLSETSITDTEVDPGHYAWTNSIPAWPIDVQETNGRGLKSIAYGTSLLSQWGDSTDGSSGWIPVNSYSCTGNPCLGGTSRVGTFTINEVHISQGINNVNLRVESWDGRTQYYRLGSLAYDITNPVTPSITLNPLNPDGDNDWYIVNVQATITSSDATSPIVEECIGTDYSAQSMTDTACAKDLVYTEAINGHYAYYASAQDAAGNKAFLTTPTSFSIDKTNPSFSLSFADGSGNTDPGIWHSDVEPKIFVNNLQDTLSGIVTLTIQKDAEAPIDLITPVTPVGSPGVGVTTQYSTIEYSLASAPDGHHTYTVRATDAAGNVASNQMQIYIDRTKPVVSGAVVNEISQPGGMDTVALEITVSDPNAPSDGSGVDWTTDEFEYAFDDKDDTYTTVPGTGSSGVATTQLPSTLTVQSGNEAEVSPENDFVYWYYDVQDNAHPANTQSSLSTLGLQVHELDTHWQGAPAAYPRQILDTKASTDGISFTRATTDGFAGTDHVCAGSPTIDETLDGISRSCLVDSGQLATTEEGLAITTDAEDAVHPGAVITVEIDGLVIGTVTGPRTYNIDIGMQCYVTGPAPRVSDNCDSGLSQTTTTIESDTGILGSWQSADDTITATLPLQDGSNNYYNAWEIEICMQDFSAITICTFNLVRAAPYLVDMESDTPSWSPFTVTGYFTKLRSTDPADYSFYGHAQSETTNRWLDLLIDSGPTVDLLTNSVSYEVQMPPGSLSDTTGFMYAGIAYTDTGETGVAAAAGDGFSNQKIKVAVPDLDAAGLLIDTVLPNGDPDGLLGTVDFGGFSPGAINVASQNNLEATVTAVNSLAFSFPEYLYLGGAATANNHERIALWNGNLQVCKLDAPGGTETECHTTDAGGDLTFSTGLDDGAHYFAYKLVATNQPSSVNGILAQGSYSLDAGLYSITPA